jgi:hypothetical protein
MDVDDPAGEAPDEGPIQQLHEAGEHNEVDEARLEPVAHGPVPRRAIGIVGDGKDRRLHARALRAREPTRRGRARADGDHLDSAAPVHLVQQRLQVRAGARDEDSDAKAHGQAGGCFQPPSALLAT